jgi:hypothetical protein
MSEAPLTAEQEALAQQIFEKLQKPYRDEALRLARLLAQKPDHQLLGPAEFEVRDGVHRLGAHTLQAALDARKKGATRAPA